jgi:hypothetical protein
MEGGDPNHIRKEHSAEMYIKAEKVEEEAAWMSCS